MSASSSPKTATGCCCLEPGTRHCSKKLFDLAQSRRPQKHDWIRGPSILALRVLSSYHHREVSRCMYGEVGMLHGKARRILRRETCRGRLLACGRWELGLRRCCVAVRRWQLGGEWVMMDEIWQRLTVTMTMNALCTSYVPLWSSRRSRIECHGRKIPSIISTRLCIRTKSIWKSIG